jgi:hypothetical protein
MRWRENEREGRSVDLRSTGWSRLAILCFVLTLPLPSLAQRRYSVDRPRERAATDPVKIRTTSRGVPTNGVLAVLLEPILPGQIIVRTRAGREVGRAEADAENGQAEFTLPRGVSYTIEASHPGYTATSTSAPRLGAQAVARIRMFAESSTVKLRDLPEGSVVQVDGVVQPIRWEGGGGILTGLRPGTYALQVRHPEFNDFEDTFVISEAGEEINYPRLPLTRMAKLSVVGPAGAILSIDGAILGKIPPEGRVQIDYEVRSIEERTITVELVGYHPWTLRDKLLPGPRALEVELAPIVTSAGTTDFFDRLVQWQTPATWRVVVDERNSRLEVRGGDLGLLKERIYRDFEANFTLWFPDGKGAAWAVRVNPSGEDYYLFSLTGPNAREAGPLRFTTYLVRRGAPPLEVGTPVPLLVDLSAAGSYTIGLTVRNSTIQHTITSNETGETNDLGIWTDTSLTRDEYLYGTFGFRALRDEIFLVDDFHLIPLRTP